MKFSIRDLFLVTVIVAVCVAWWVDHRYQAEVAKRHETIMRSLGISVEQEGSRVTYTLPPSLPFPNSSAPAPNPPKP